MRNYFRFIHEHKRFLGFGFALTFFSSVGQTFLIALFNEPIRLRFDLSHGEYGFVYSLATLASGLLLISAGRSLDLRDLRVVTLMIGIGLAAACGLMAASWHVVALWLAIFGLRFCGQGMMGHTAMVTMARYFDAQRGKAVSIASMGFTAGEAVLPIVGVAMITLIGWRLTWGVIAVLLVFVAAPLLMWLLGGHGKRHSAWVDDTAKRESQALEGGHRQWRRREVVRDPRFYLIIPAVLTPAFVVTGVFFHQIHLVSSKGWTPGWWATSFVAFAAAQLPALALSGPLVDRIGAMRLTPFFLSPLVLGLILLTVFDSAWIAPVFLAFAGLTSGAGGTVIGAMWAEMYGVRHLGAIRALASSLMVLSTALSPVTMGWLIDGGVTMEQIATGCCVYAVVVSLLAKTGVSK